MENGKKGNALEVYKRSKQRITLFMATVFRGLLNELKTMGRKPAERNAGSMTTAVTHFRIFR